MPAPRARLALMEKGEAFFFAQLAGLDDGALAGPSALPGWTRAHVVAHMAGNADALGNLLAWARTGVETPMYSSTAQRARDIEMGAGSSPAVLRAALEDASARLLGAFRELPAVAWDAPLRTVRGRPITGADVPWMRIRENWIHAVDLAAGATFFDLPPALVAEFVDEVAGGFKGRDDCPAMIVRSDEGGLWEIGSGGVGGGDVGGGGVGGGPVVEVSGPLADVAAWLLGRDEGSGLTASTLDGRPPAPPAWL